MLKSSQTKNNAQLIKLFCLIYKDFPVNMKHIFKSVTMFSNTRVILAQVHII